ncbi:class I SAM-dependent methyltransferase [Leisingera daeponensis]|uniref:class I SAM-dependent methyltransferase n=1 Tax=Leisingera daeponensis TaxID=405746 RepID=UPI0004044747|nr:class I SAM-dependent methyltransferase [Leisingera daeponensis]
MTTVLETGFNEMEDQIAIIWADILKHDVQTMSPDTDFFAAGGHSLAAMIMVARVKKDLGKSVPLFALVENPTISDFAKIVTETSHGAIVEEAPTPDGSKSQTERLLGYNDDERRQKRHNWFEQYYATAMDSAAHAEFCEQVYGDNFGQHGMADFSQIDLLLEAMKPTKGDVILDIGCGYGLISKYIMEKTGAKVVGVDISPSAIEFAKSLALSTDKLEFHVMDVKDLDFPEDTFTHIISIDTIYYFPSPQGALQTFKKIGTPDVAVGVLRTFPIRTFTKETWKPERTELATLMDAEFGSYDAVDLSKEENEHWTTKVRVLKSLEDKFRAEGNDALYEFRFGEAEYEAGIEQFRYMFVARAS